MSPSALRDCDGAEIETLAAVIEKRAKAAEAARRDAERKR